MVAKYDGTNDYGDLIEKWKVRLIVSRARHYGFPKHQWEDVQQDLILDVMAFEFDPAKSNGASETTALIALIDKKLIDRLRAATRERKHLERRNAALGITESTTEDSPALSQRDDIPLRADVHQAMGLLTARQRAICAALAEGRSVSEIARRLGCGWHTVERAIVAIRRAFKEVGLDGWVRA